MRAVLAVDGGQSGIRLRHSALARIVEVGGVSRTADTGAAVARVISDALSTGAFPPADRVVLGLTTAPWEVNEANRLCALVAVAAAANEVWLADDTVTGHCGALSGEWGLCLIVGTGVACLAVPESGHPRVFDGHGYLLGDEGGAFWIGRRALQLTLRAHDRDEYGPLTELVRARFGTLDGLHNRLHESETPINDIAQFAKDIIAASTGNQVASHILDDAAARLYATLTDALGVFAHGEIALALGGRLLEDPESPLRQRLATLTVQQPRFAVRNADGTPLDGALRLGGFDSPGRYRDLVHVWKEEKAA